MVTKSVRLRAQMVTRRPFTAVIVEKEYRGDSNEPSRTYVYLRAFKADGSQVTVKGGRSPDKSGGWKQTRGIVDLTSRRAVTVDEFTESLIGYPLSDGDTTFYRSWPKSECTGHPELERSTYLGYEVRKAEKELGEGTHLELLMAPALDCFALQESWTLPPADGVKHRASREAVYIMEGEPAAALFNIPTTYVERTPSQVAAEFARRYPEHGPPFPGKTSQLLDNTYRARGQPQH
jgi:hypothetical protein